MQKKLKVAVVGATGAVGRELLKILDERQFPVAQLVPFASPQSLGKKILFQNREFQCQVLEKGCFKDVDIAFFDASDQVSQEWVPQAAEAGSWVVDNSATFRLAEDVLLLVPEVNGHLLEALVQSRVQSSEKTRLLEQSSSLSPRQRILTGPNCSTVQMVVALKPIHEHLGIKRVVVSTYQSTSGAGSAAMEELRQQSLQFLNQQPLTQKVFPHPIAFNCIPHIGGFQVDGSTSEELKMISESRKLLNLPDLRISATAVRVPTLNCHCESINVEVERPFELDQVRSFLAKQSGLILVDDPSQKRYPMGLARPGSSVEGGAGRDPVYVGRLRRDFSVENGLNFWVVSDNLRKGAALNAVQIGEALL